MRVGCGVSVFVLLSRPFFVFVFFFTDTATTEIYTLSLHDALPIAASAASPSTSTSRLIAPSCCECFPRSEEHTSELQSLRHLVCRLLLEKKNKTTPRREREREPYTVTGPKTRIGHQHRHPRAQRSR